jgi:phosphodiesterase/alkaline phosphatase D-like protein
MAGSIQRFISFRRATGKDFVVEYNKAITIAGQKEYTIHSGDVIYVPYPASTKSQPSCRKSARRRHHGQHRGTAWGGL